MSGPEKMNLAQFLNEMSLEQLVALLRKIFGNLVALNIEASFPVTEGAFEKLTGSEVETIANEAAVRFGDDIGRWRNANFPHFRREVLRYGCTISPKLLTSKTGMTNANPPPDIHSMVRHDVFAGDLYSGDMVASAASRAGFEFEESRHYLDFGCSSASVVRNMAAAFPKSNWHGCDPIPEAIEWASRFFPNITLLRSEQSPPLPYPQGRFHGVYAISIWSHFSERAALSWFDEMHRILEPGGFLIFTTHGYRSVVHYAEQGIVPQLLAGAAADLLFDQFAFRHYWTDPSQEFGLDVADWGMAFFAPEWVTRRLYRKFRLADFQPGLSQANQDVYVLARV